jgi:hypothetical protein
MLIFNDKALIAAGLGAVVGFSFFISFNNPILGVVIGTIVAMGVDVYMRFHSEDSTSPLIDPNAGAHVWFAPVWLVGIIGMVVAGLFHFRVI